MNRDWIAWTDSGRAWLTQGRSISAALNSASLSLREGENLLGIVNEDARLKPGANSPLVNIVFVSTPRPATD